jgi:hypothetical protein
MVHLSTPDDFEARQNLWVRMKLNSNLEVGLAENRG